MMARRTAMGDVWIPGSCTMEARICPDGSTVGRGGPNCQFAPCPPARPWWQIPLPGRDSADVRAGGGARRKCVTWQFPFYGSRFVDTGQRPAVGMPVEYPCVPALPELNPLVRIGMTLMSVYVAWRVVSP